MRRKLRLLNAQQKANLSEAAPEASHATVGSEITVKNLEVIPEDIEKEALNETFEPEKNMLTEVQHPLSKTVKQPKDSEKRHKFFGKHMTSDSYSSKKSAKPGVKPEEEEKRPA